MNSTTLLYGVILPMLIVSVFLLGLLLGNIYSDKQFENKDNYMAKCVMNNDNSNYLEVLHACKQSYAIYTGQATNTEK